MRKDHHDRVLCEAYDKLEHMKPCESAIEKQPSRFSETFENGPRLCRCHRMENEANIETWEKVLEKIPYIRLEKSFNGSHFQGFDIYSVGRDWNAHLTIETVFGEAPEIISVYCAMQNNHERRQYALAQGNDAVSDLLHNFYDWMVAQQNELLF